MKEISTTIYPQNFKKNNIIKIELIIKGIKLFTKIEIESSYTKFLIESLF